MTPVAALVSVSTKTADVPAWVACWGLAYAIFLACKVATWRRARTRLGPLPRGRTWAYLLAWPGMDARAFLDPAVRPRPVTETEWGAALIKVALGASLVWGAAAASAPLAAAWIGLVGIGFLLNFGLFHLLSLAWRAAGFEARPIFDAPALARSLGDFWGRRWNRAFSRLATDYVYGPTARRLGPATASPLVFLISGLLHDLVLSVPAGGGYGRPTLYFLLQAAGVRVERSRRGRRLGLRRGVRGWLFTVLVAAAPLGLLFHPPFMRAVVRPLLAAMGALP